MGRDRLRISLMLASIAFGLLWMSASSVAAQTDVPRTSRTRGEIGLGAAAMLDGMPSLQFVYDPGAWHLEVLANAHTRPNRVGLGVRGFYHLHSAEAADFSIGGGLGYVHQGGDNTVAPELAIQIRAFIVSNVALSGTAGIALPISDGDVAFVLTAQLIGGVAVTYFF